jgi:hypothetical protein
MSIYTTQINNIKIKYKKFINGKEYKKVTSHMSEVIYMAKRRREG